MPDLSGFARELSITALAPGTWLAIGLSLLFGGICLAFGTSIARAVGFLEDDAPASEVISVGLASGLIVLAAMWAAVWSGGRSSFTPVAVGFAISIGFAMHARAGPSLRGTWPRRATVISVADAALFVVAIALIYGAVLAPRARDGVQPMENPDQAYYAVLGRDLDATGIETNLSASGFSDLSDLPGQAWYHWGELWLASGVIKLTGAGPMEARDLTVMPVVLLAAAGLAGTIVRRLAGSRSRWAFAFGFAACLFLAPVSLIPGPYFSSWAFGMLLGITVYGLGTVAGTLALYVLVLGNRQPMWATSVFIGSAIAFILPAHIVVAVLATVGAAAVWTIEIARSLLKQKRVPVISPAWQRYFFASGLLVVTTAAWAAITGHGLGGSGGTPAGIDAFNASWSASVAITALGGGMLLLIPIAWVLVRTSAPREAELYLGTMALILVGALLWGWRMRDFNNFYLFFAGIAVFATPLAAVAVLRVLDWLREAKHLRIAACLVVGSLLQLSWGALIKLPDSLAKSAPLPDRQPIPLGVLDAIRNLPPDAKLAYACRPFEEATFAQPQLLSVDLHTGRRIVPMCFEADTVSHVIGGARRAEAPNSSFASAPQRALYPTADARPSPEAMASFLKAHGIDFIYADTIHPNSLVPAAVAIASIGGVEVLRIP